jgi:hypothetical protein
VSAPDDKAETMAQMMASVVRLSQLLNVTIEDATTLYIKIVSAMGAKRPH